jgi:hypothetical protein
MEGLHMTKNTASAALVKSFIVHVLVVLAFAIPN